MSEAKKYTYRNTSTDDLTIMDVGVCKAGETITTNQPIENPNFELVTDGYHSKSEQRRVEATKPKDGKKE